MNTVTAFDAAFAQCPLVAILRGVRPDEVETIGEALVSAGFTLIEVPLNSPNPYDSIERLARAVGTRAIVGAGTVLNAGQVEQVASAGGRLIVSPNTDPGVIAAARAAGLVSLPGIATPSEAFAALGAGANVLKLFPAEGASPAVLKAMRAVLPPETRILPVGGITPEGMANWTAAGAAGFGLGSALYKSGDDAATVATRASRFCDAWSALCAPNH